MNLLLTNEFFSLKMTSRKQRNVISINQKSKIINRREAGEKAIDINTTVRTICSCDNKKIQRNDANVSLGFSKTIVCSRQPIHVY